MRRGRNITLAIAALMLAACASTPMPAATNGADFVWGCWVSKDKPGGRALGFLRLLKDGPDAQSYRGYLHTVRDNEMNPVLQLTVTRDGTYAAVVKDGDTTEFASSGPKGQRIDYLSATPGRTGSLMLSGGDDRLSLNLQLGWNGMAYTFERDGCD